MNFREIEHIENLALESASGTSDFLQDMLAEYLDDQKKKASAKEQPFVFFYEDAIRKELDYDFKAALGEINYEKAAKDALACLTICRQLSKISTWSIDGWLQNSLRFADHIVLHYIQDHCQETPKRYGKAGVEKSRYKQLSEKKGDIGVAGFQLIELYDLRNKLEHRTITHPDGKQELVPPQKNKVRRTVVKVYPDVLHRFLQTYKDNVGTAGE